jgi:ankyrin repeat protein
MHSPESQRNVLSEALRAGDPAKVKGLINAGAKIKYRDENGYDALIDAVHGRDVVRDSRLIELLDLLVKHGVQLSGITNYNESGLRVLSRLGRFDAVQFLLRAGADRSHLQWSPLIESVALGSLADVETLVYSGAPLEARDYWERTAWLIAIQTGDIAKADLLRRHGANVEACGRCGKPPLFYAIENHHCEMLRWLLACGLDPEQTDEFGTTSLITAVEANDLDCVETLLAANVAIDRVHHGSTAIASARSRPVTLGLLAAGADPAELSHEGRRVLVGLPAETTSDFLNVVSAQDFLRARTRRFGTANPELITEPFWDAMIRGGMGAYAANQHFGGESSCGSTPVWCAQRFGQTLTILPDGRAIQIAGEHEDHYDPDFCIYNDVFVHETDGSIRIYGYPETVFPPTDFHSATLVQDWIFILGSLGYGREIISETPIYRLDVRTFQIERVRASGNSPGWIHRHRAKLTSANEIVIEGGEVLTDVNGKRLSVANSRTYFLDLNRMEWRLVHAPGC